MWRLAAGPDLTDAALLHQSALWVIIGDPAGDARTAAAGALGPAGGLHHTLLHMTPLRLRAESCRDKQLYF